MHKVTPVLIACVNSPPLETALNGVVLASQGIHSFVLVREMVTEAAGAYSLTLLHWFCQDAFPLEVWQQEIPTPSATENKYVQWIKLYLSQRGEGRGL